MDRNVIETAFISGRFGQAIYRIDEQVFTVTLDGEATPALPGDFQEVFSPGAEYQVFRQQTIESIQDALRKLVRNYNALFLVLSLLDPNVSLSTRVVAAQAAEGLLTGNEEREFVSCRLLSVPLPVQVRARRHEIVSPWVQFVHVKALISEVFECQHIMDEVSTAWTKAMDAQPIEEVVRSSVYATLVSKGFFAGAARAISIGDHYRFNSLVVACATDREMLEDISGAQSLLTAFRSEVHSRFFGKAPKTQKLLRFKKGEPVRQPRRTGETDPVSQLIYGSGPASEKPHAYVGALEAKSRVDKQIDAIREAMYADKKATVERYLQDLLEFQLGHGDREHAAMSLCALTTIALDANQFEMADRLSQYALSLTSDDKVVFTNRAEVLKQSGHFDAALKSYKEAIERFTGDRWARNGYADVLKEKGLFDEAIARYRENQTTFPDDPVAFNGEVGVFKAKGDQRGALRLALRCVKRFEYDAVSRSVLAGCLVSLGKYEDAIRHYWQAIGLDRFNLRIQVSYLLALGSGGKVESALNYADTVLKKTPGAFPVLNTKATLLKNAGRLHEAAEIFQKLIERYPTYTPAKFGLASVRVLESKPEDAQRSLPEDNPESELDWFGFRVKALSYGSVGNYQQATPRLSFALKNCPWLRERPKIETALGLVEFQRGDFVRSTALFNNNLDLLDARDRQVRITLLAHVHAEKGAKDIAAVLLGSLFSSKEHDLQSVRGAIINEYKLPVPLSGPWNVDPGQIRSLELGLAMAA